MGRLKIMRNEVKIVELMFTVGVVFGLTTAWSALLSSMQTYLCRPQSIGGDIFNSWF